MEYEYYILYDIATGWSHHVTATVIRSCNTEKVMEDFGTNNIIQYGKSMLALWIIHRH